ncbi:hypothetical protein EV183_001653 [Coemansia sp. RSA 2336]|nr:hypothetical protein EV183_001653 [Coemansia sp. RSA 2336]
MSEPNEAFVLGNQPSVANASSGTSAETDLSPSSVDKKFQNGLTITASIALFGSLLTIITFFILLAFNSRRVNIPLVKITMSIQSVNAIALIISLILNQIHITSLILCGSLRYILYICYLASIFMCTAVTVHLWLVITKRKLVQAKRHERWYYILPFTLATVLSASLGTIPSGAYGQPNRCAPIIIPSHNYLAIRWGLYYGWFVIASVISFWCMFSVLRSTRSLMHTTYTHARPYPSSTEAYRNAVNARANSKRLRSLAFYTIAYPVISFMCNCPQLVQELVSSVAKRELRWFVFIGRLCLFSEGFFLSVTFFLYPAVRHSIRDMTNSAVQYWVVDQEEYWRMRKIEPNRTTYPSSSKNTADKARAEEHVVRDFNSYRGRLYHFLFSLTPEGRMVTHK